MKVTKDKTENSQVFLTIEMEPAEVEESLEEAYHHMVNETKVPGFRKGKAPRPVLERHVGKESLFEHALNHLIPEAYEKAINEHKIEAIAQPHIEITQTEPLVFKAIVPLLPTVELGDYHSIKVSQKPAELTEDDVNTAIEQLRHQHATWEPMERPVDSGDLIGLDVESSVGGEPFINQKGAQYQVIRESSAPAPGFAEQLLGMNVGTDKEFEIKLPSDYSRSELADKEASFKVKVTEVKQEKLPELNDDFAKQASPDFKTMDELREQLSSNLKLRAEEMARADFEGRVVEAAVDLAQLEFPPILVEVEIDQLLREQMQRSRMGDEELEEYLRRINKTNEELREELHPIATGRVAQSLVLGKVAEEGKIEVSESEIDAEIENMMKGATENRGEFKNFLNNPQTRQSIKRVLLTRKTVQHLTEIAEGSGKKPKKAGGKKK
ncbi:trigger factor [Chloroflexota bacterium]